ncbi:L-alanine-DL-glutamate epimerase-like enolase superfamily enzyme [Parabacteroides sp. PH5-13]|uniref:mandelate racemase/muconate lactonizing enzyme family protein n=1 Tax=unclassified Parabacteroides TaxID=2649774 RepID=UPI002475DD84|nr:MULTISPECIES: mandelate racemase/muconate lactonizing enzyme family protein [unclassified Parabacteroides]MDH6304816.1 L-alanine-DL-glutamate epimerase-like enolase superfamily enzyme [Parabacteroides sp. PH5-39]MDH6319230.1 L-alanine-DL-glutamate epimerase-like enolase superfamily enzyme [Parabacteroides sp. PH5-13]MDH6322961.1 L-alanine-DL-glutamate epimerase-like enolase superfamily enzyme [Parabacteroides sp. PH5-8]MDH6384317.1 L-alanine-DL-glutamate epimerase-like enolase superfamily en
MKTELKKIIETEKNREQAELATTYHEKAAAPENGRRTFFKRMALGGITLGGMMQASIEDTVAQTTSKVNRLSSPSELKITDMRYAVVGNVGRTPIIRIDTNQGIYGLGEVRDGGDERFALMLKSRLIGQNPCNVEMLFKIIRQFGHHGRQGGGVCAVEMALWDLCGKAYGVPAWQLLGGRYRDKIRLYADTPDAGNPAEFAKVVKARMQEQGFTWLKMDLGIHLAKDIENTIVNNKFWNGAKGQYDLREYMGYGNTLHPFTQIQITDKALESLQEYVEAVRNAIGYEVPLCADHFGHFDVNNSIRFAKAMDKYRLAWVEDMVPWTYTEQWKTVTNAVETPTCTGEDIYCLKDGFKPLIDAHAVDIIHPDLATSGGLLETKRIGDYAEEHGIPMAMHMAGTPICFMANVHCAAATQNFLSLEHHSVDTPWWEGLVKMTGAQPMVTKGFANVPLDSPGLGIELNEDVVKEHLHRSDKSFFKPTPEWNDKRSHDRLWS